MQRLDEGRRLRSLPIVDLNIVFRSQGHQKGKTADCIFFSVEKVLCSCLTINPFLPQCVFHGHSMGTYPDKSSHATCQITFSHSQLTEPLCTDPGIKSRIGVNEQISTVKKEEERSANGE